MAAGVGFAVVFAVMNRTQTGQTALLSAENTLSDTGQALGITDKMSQQEKNIRAFLQMIRIAEGTGGIDGYRMLVGGGLFFSFADHPRKVITITSNGKQIKSSAAGAFQIIAPTWDGLRRQINFPDFSPENQDNAAIQLIREKGALEDVKAGRFDAAVSKVRAIWASMPGAGYGQPERKLADLKSAYISAGGVAV